MIQHIAFSNNKGRNTNKFIELNSLKSLEIDGQYCTYRHTSFLL